MNLPNKRIDKSMILQLLNLKREGDFWDFKEYWYKNNADMLGDILNFANTTHHRDCYIIMGIKDDDFSIKGIEEDDKNRKNNQMVLDFLRKLHFDGGRIPNVTVSNFKIQEKNIDVISIIDSDQVPFYLYDSYKYGRITIPAGTIYSRIGDVNTPKNQSTNLTQLEGLVKKRWGMDITPGNRLIHSLNNPNKWEKRIINENEYYYFIDEPSYQIKIIDENENLKEIMPFSFDQMDPTVRWYRIQLAIGETLIYEHQAVSLDGGRYFNVVPVQKFLSTDNATGSLSLKYYILVNNSIEKKLYNFFKEKQIDSTEAKIADAIYTDSVIFLKDDAELKNLENNLNEIFKDSVSSIKQHSDEDIKVASERIRHNVGGNYNFNGWASEILDTNKIANVVKSDKDKFITD